MSATAKKDDSGYWGCVITKSAHFKSFNNMQVWLEMIMLIM